MWDLSHPEENGFPRWCAAHGFPAGGASGRAAGGTTPCRSSEKHGDVRGVEVHHARRNGISLHGLIDGRKDNDILRYVNDGAAAGEIGDDFVFVLFLGKSVRR